MTWTFGYVRMTWTLGYIIKDCKTVFFFLIAVRIDLKVDLYQAAKIVALRVPLEAMIVRATKLPEQVAIPNPQEAPLMSVVRSLSRLFAGRHGLPQER